MIKLDLPDNSKKITVNGKEVKVPKLGLKHYNLIKELKTHEENYKILMESIHKGLSVAEKDLVAIHLMAHNKAIKDRITQDDFVFDVNNVYISQKLKFEYKDYCFKFKSPKADDRTSSVDVMLSSCCVSATKGGVKIDIPNFFDDTPAFVYKWAEFICDTIAIKDKDGKEIKGLYNIVELFNGS